LSWELAAVFVAIGFVCFVAGLASAACFEAREQQWLESRALDARRVAPSDERARVASVTILDTALRTRADASRRP